MLKFDGETYDPELDEERLSEQHARVSSLMSDFVWRTLSEISKATKDPEASVSARLRDLRKKRFGSWVVEHRCRGVAKNGLWEYKISPPGTISPYAVKPRKNKWREALKAIWLHPATTKEQRELIRENLS